MAEIRDSDYKTKVIAFYLPQFHRIPENDKAYGQGFTEWTNIKKAKPLFEGHYQPKIPLNKNYYNLLDEKVQLWQASIAEKYGVYGFCYYHYWFKNGKKLLEKPAENMLRNKNINIPFCFCWANENWSKLWDGGNRELIVKQEYGNQTDWEKHFQYLLSYFKDKRYITIDGKPILIIYKPQLIPALKEMLTYFRRRSAECGFPGVELMYQFPSYTQSAYYDKNLFDHYIDFQPISSIIDLSNNRNKYVKLKKCIINIFGENFARILTKSKLGKNRTQKPESLKKIDYDVVWNIILNRNYSDGKIIAGAFTDFDNTPRRKNGYVFINTSLLSFSNYFSKLVSKVKKEGNLNVIFIDAWNEWGEGAYLEPDEKNKFSYLEAINNAVCNLEE